MSLAEKIIKLRKNIGLSQEELAEKINVPRQVIYKWEKGQITPEIKKIVELSELFNVTTDYLLKDDIDDEKSIDDNEKLNIKDINIFEVNKFIKWRKKASVMIAVATFLCIVSVIPLIILVELAQNNMFGINQEIASGVGIITMFFIVAIAVTIFILCELKNSPYKYLNYGVFEMEHDVRRLVKHKKTKYINTYNKYNIVAIFLCITSVIPLFLGVFFKNNIFKTIMLAITILIIGIGVILFIISGVRLASMKKLLKE